MIYKKNSGLSKTEKIARVIKLDICRQSVDGLLQLHLYEMCEVFTQRLQQAFVPTSESIEWGHYELENGEHDGDQVWITMKGTAYYGVNEPKIMIIRVPLILAVSDDINEIDTFLETKKKMMEESDDPDNLKPSEMESDVKRVIH